MPIEVRHDTGGGALARLAALSGLTQQQNVEAAREQQAFLTVQGREQQDRQQAQALAAQRDRQQEQIQAAAQRQMQAADTAAARTALAAGLDKQVKEDAFNRELQTIQAEAKARAEQWEYQYSAKARQDIARGNDALQRIAQMKAAGEIDATTAARMTHEVNLGMSGITSNRVPVSPDKVPKERQPGFSEFDEQGNFRVRDKDGVFRIEQPWFETPDGKQKIHDWDLELEKAKRETGRRKARETTRAKLANELIPVRTEEGTAIEGRTRYREPWELERDVERAHPTPPPDPTKEELTEEFYRRNPEKTARRVDPGTGRTTQVEVAGVQIRRTIIDDAEKNFGMSFSASDRKALENVSPEASEAIVYIRAVESKYGSIAEAPTKVRLEAEAAVRLLRREDNAGVQ